MNIRHHYKVTSRRDKGWSAGTNSVAAEYRICEKCNPQFLLKLRVDTAEFEHHECIEDKPCDYCYDNPALTIEGLRLRRKTQCGQPQRRNLAEVKANRISRAIEAGTMDVSTSKRFG